MTSGTLPMSQILCCKLCFGIYKSPKLLPCLHSFCARCLVSYCAGCQNNQTFLCPTCSSSFELTNGTVDELWDNVVLERAINHSVKQIHISSDTPVFHGEKDSTEYHKNDANVSEISSTRNAQGFLLDTKTNNKVQQDRMRQSVSCYTMPKENFMSDSVQKSDTVSSFQHKNYEPLGQSSEILYDHSSFPKSSSGISNFSISSLKFKPPSDYDILDVSNNSCASVNNVSGYTSTKTEGKLQAPCSTERPKEEKTQIQDDISKLQTAALDKIYALDEINNEAAHWQTRIAECKHKIQQRSTELQILIKKHERQVLSELDDIIIQNDIFNKIETHKEHMHNCLKSILSTIDFSRLLLDYAKNDGEEYLFDMLEEKIKTLKLDECYKITWDLGFCAPDCHLVEGLIPKIFGSVLQSQDHLNANDDTPDTNPMSTSKFTQVVQEIETYEKQFSDMQMEEKSVITPDFTERAPMTWDRGSEELGFNSVKEKAEKEEKNNFVSQIQISLSSAMPGNDNEITSSRDTQKTLAKRNSALIEKGDNSMQKEKDNSTSASVAGTKNIDVKTNPGLQPKITKRKIIRRHTEGNIKYDSGKFSFFSSNDNPLNQPRLRHFTDEIQKTKFMIDLCRTRILSAQMSSVYPFSQSSDFRQRRRFSVQDSGLRHQAPSMTEALGVQRKEFERKRKEDE